MRNQGRLGTFRINETARLSTQSPGAWVKFAKAIAMNKEPGIGKSIGRLAAGWRRNLRADRKQPNVHCPQNCGMCFQALRQPQLPGRPACNHG
jgi:hypothetical protein